ncbi:hypothetical protein G6F31_020368 [Rhizopus arrhizus]|nr:hypothetical protein G6F31_020368 [Rhizopus arrhizus]
MPGGLRQVADNPARRSRAGGQHHRPDGQRHGPVPDAGRGRRCRTGRGIPHARGPAMKKAEISARGVRNSSLVRTAPLTRKTPLKATTGLQRTPFKRRAPKKRAGHEPKAWG